jgi:hypothetical protein
MSDRTRREIDSPQDMAPWPQEVAPRNETIDLAIDRAVREMMNVDADPAFRSRVLARLDRPAPHWFSWPRAAVAAAAAAALLLSLVLPWTTREEAPPSSIVKYDSRPAAPAASPHKPDDRSIRADGSARPLIRRPVVRVSARPNVTHVLPAGTVTAAAAVVDDPPAVAVEALGHLAPIVVEPLTPSSIAPAPIAVPPLAPITELTIAPLAPRIERD